MKRKTDLETEAEEMQACVLNVLRGMEIVWRPT